MLIGTIWGIFKKMQFHNLEIKVLLVFYQRVCSVSLNMYKFINTYNISMTSEFGFEPKSNIIVVFPSVYLASDYSFAFITEDFIHSVPVVIFCCLIVCNYSLDFHCDQKLSTSSFKFLGVGVLI